MPADLPPLGTRWGSLSAEQRRALPVGTVLHFPTHDRATFDLIRGERRWMNRDGSTVRVDAIHGNRVIFSYPEAAPCVPS